MMPPVESSYADDFERQIEKGIRLYGAALIDGARDLPMLSGISPRGEVTAAFENKLAEARNILVASGCVYRRNDGIIMAIGRGETGRLVNLAVGSQVSSNAAKF